MKCPECGQWNRSHFTTCQNCGAPLEAEASAEPEWRSALRDGEKANQYIRVNEQGEVETAPDSRDELAKEMNELKVRKAEGSRLQRRLREDTARQTPEGTATVRTSATAQAGWDLTEQFRREREQNAQPEDGETRRIPVKMVGKGKKREAGEPLPPPVRRVDLSGRNDAVSEADANVRLYDPMNGEQEYSGTWSLPPLQPTSSVKVKLPSRRRGTRMVVRVLLSIVILGLVGVAGYFGWQYYSLVKEQQTEENAAIITASIMDDLAAHIIMIPGEDGQQIYIRELHTSYIVTGGFATIEVADHTWYDDYEEALNPTMEVTLTPFVKKTSGQQEALPVIHYDIDIPLSPIPLNTPDSVRSEVATSMYTMKLTVRPGSKLTVNGVDCSDAVDSETGAVSYNATVQPIGDNEYTFVVRSQYCRENTLTVVLYRETQEIPLDLAADIYGTTNSSRMKVSATTLPGATVEVLSNYSDLDITNIDSTGAFTFYALFDKIGDNTITITSSYPGKKTSTINYTVYYLPPASEYTTKAWKLDESGYSELVGNIQARVDNTQVYVVMGVVDSFVSEKPQMAVIYTSEDGTSQPVLVENNTSKTLVQGQYYRIYADVSGTYNSMPWLQGRFVYTE